MVIQETLRWLPVAVNTFYHAVTEDDEFPGYHIPKGSWVVANVWGIHLDPQLYPNTDSFNPIATTTRGSDVWLWASSVTVWSTLGRALLRFPVHSYLEDIVGVRYGAEDKARW